MKTAVKVDNPYSFSVHNFAYNVHWYSPPPSPYSISLNPESLAFYIFDFNSAEQEPNL